MSSKKYFLILFSLIILFFFGTFFINEIEIKEKYLTSVIDKDFLILSYQKKKIASTENIEIIFLGDSSLGNGLNTKVFTNLSDKKTLNLALTEIYGFAGQYNLLREAYKNNKNSLKKVFIINSISFFDNSLEEEAFFISSNSFYDILHSSNIFKFSFNYIKYMIKYVIMGKEDGYETFLSKNIKNDYIVQSDKKDLIYKKNLEIIDYKKKTKFLKLINDFCKKNNIDLYTVVGPLYDKTYIDNRKIFENLLKDFQIVFKKLNIPFIKDIILLNNSQIGDFYTHSNYNYKNELTKRIYLKLKDNNFL